LLLATIGVVFERKTVVNLNKQIADKKYFIKRFDLCKISPIFVILKHDKKVD